MHTCTCVCVRERDRLRERVRERVRERENDSERTCSMCLSSGQTGACIKALKPSRFVHVMVKGLTTASHIKGEGGGGACEWEREPDVLFMLR
jgi:hypothetical protein